MQRKLHSVSSQKDFRFMPCKIVISEDIFKSTPEYQLTYNKDLLKYLLEPKREEGGEGFTETQPDIK